MPGPTEPAAGCFAKPGEAELSSARENLRRGRCAHPEAGRLGGGAFFYEKYI